MPEKITNNSKQQVLKRFDFIIKIYLLKMIT